MNNMSASLKCRLLTVMKGHLVTHFVLTTVLQIPHTAITVEDIEKHLALIIEKLQNERLEYFLAFRYVC